jgi:hypothetical protein
MAVAIQNLPLAFRLESSGNAKELISSFVTIATTIGWLSVIPAG